VAKKEQAAKSKPNKAILHVIWPRFRGEITGTAIVLAATITVSCFYWAEKNPKNQAELHRLFIILSVAWAIIAANWLIALLKLLRLKVEDQEEGNEETHEKTNEIANKP
jgi:hypothetical protein